jgi:hypothetical protein
MFDLAASSPKRDKLMMMLPKIKRQINAAASKAPKET